VALTLTVSAQDVQLAVTAPIEAYNVGDKWREHALRILSDRLGALGGALTMTSSGSFTKIRCHVPVSIENPENLGVNLGARSRDFGGGPLVP
jgi:signal transduction histidine kinase